MTRVNMHADPLTEQQKDYTVHIMRLLHWIGKDGFIGLMSASTSTSQKNNLILITRLSPGEGTRND